jgi:hypothetical protein
MFPALLQKLQQATRAPSTIILFTILGAIASFNELLARV